MIRYATLTYDQRQAVIDRYTLALQLGATDVKHAAAIAAHDVFPWKGRKCRRDDLNRHVAGRCRKCEHDTDAYAVALAVIIHRGHAKAEVLVDDDSCPSCGYLPPRHAPGCEVDTDEPRNCSSYPLDHDAGDVTRDDVHTVRGRFL